MMALHAAAMELRQATAHNPDNPPDRLILARGCPFDRAAPSALKGNSAVQVSNGAGLFSSVRAPSEAIVPRRESVRQLLERRCRRVAGPWETRPRLEHPPLKLGEQAGPVAACKQGIIILAARDGASAPVVKSGWFVDRTDSSSSAEARLARAALIGTD